MGKTLRQTLFAQLYVWCAPTVCLPPTAPQRLPDQEQAARSGTAQRQGGGSGRRKMVMLRGVSLSSTDSR